MCFLPVLRPTRKAVKGGQLGETDPIPRGPEVWGGEMHPTPSGKAGS